MTDQSAQDLAALQGTWAQVGFEENGVVNPPDSYEGAMGALTTIKGNHFSVRATDGRLLLEGTFSLDAALTPKTIDWMDAIGPDAGKRLPAIYRLNGDHFAFVAADADMPRPRAFHTGPGQTMRIFIRRSI
jgi:uncharacterized protein (TIGR03067 family)